MTAAESGHRIDSPQNQRFKDLRRLLSAKGIRRQGLALAAVFLAPRGH